MIGSEILFIDIMLHKVNKFSGSGNLFDLWIKKNIPNCYNLLQGHVVCLLAVLLN
ncbi:unnamed protein product [Meloidogyne enterolobii]|uniref:Uncharacterized protein n=1 Tax=Meloidogyne enterolobii TaxID=390850 RepID=A0ACB0Y507_MELEN